MASRIAETLARLRVCRDAGLPAPPDLCEDAIECLGRIVDAAEMRARRDELIRRASLFVPHGSAYQRAGVLANEAKAMARTWRHRRVDEAATEPTSLRECLRAAARHADLPESARQYYRVLKDQVTADTRPTGNVS